MPSAIDAQAKLFDACADVYARYRPSYPEATLATLVAELQLAPPALLCDLAAGTGVLSCLLAARGFRLVAVEPLDEMRKRGAQAASERGFPIEFAAGVAEAIPLADESVEAVVCGQAFHWFDADAALREIHRTLKPGGGVALLWNNWDWQRIEWLAGVERLITKYNPSHDPYYRAKDWAQIVDASRLFGPAQRFEHTHDRQAATGEILGLVESFSYVRIILPEARQQLMQEIATLVEGAQPTSGQGLRLRYRTELYVARKEKDSRPKTMEHRCRLS